MFHELIIFYNIVELLPWALGAFGIIFGLWITIVVIRKRITIKISKKDSKIPFTKK